MSEGLKPHDSTSTSSSSSSSTSSASSSSQSMTNQNHHNDMMQTSPSPASSSVSISSTTTSMPNTPPLIVSTNTVSTSSSASPPKNHSPSPPSSLPPHKQLNQSPQHINHHQQQSFNRPLLNTQTLTPNRYIPPSTNPNRYLYSNQTNNFQFQHLLQQQPTLNPNKSQNYKKQLSQSFRDILENTLLINGINDLNMSSRNANIYQSSNFMTTPSTPTQNTPNKINPGFQRVNNSNYTGTGTVKSLNKSTSSLNGAHKMHQGNQQQMIVINDLIDASLNNKKNSANDTLMDESSLINTNFQTPVHTSNTNGAPVVLNTQLAYKFAELERNLAMTKAENHNLLEQQVDILFFFGKTK